jgi:uncharacterized protein (TIGR03083 family)
MVAAATPVPEQADPGDEQDKGRSSGRARLCRMDRSAALVRIKQNADRILELLAEAAATGHPADERARIPSCPDWTLLDLANHLGRVYAMVATALESGPDAAFERARIPRRAEAQSAEDWLRERLEIVLGLLGSVEEEGRAWNFVDGPGGPVSFWWRRQAHETLIHRVDAEMAAGLPITDADPSFAADGIGDFLAISGHKQVPWEDIQLGDGMSVHLHATDAADATDATDNGNATPTEWTIDTTSRTYTERHLKADVALRGSAWALDLWIWRRGSVNTSGADGTVPAVDLEAFGDLAAAEDWRPRI